jgi:multiple sugar transport system ATP-binding protein
MAGVTIRNARKIFGPVEVLHSVSVDVEDGEFVILVGPSGCGKTTLLRMIAGLEDISDGEILIGGRRINDIPPKARDVAMVFQNYALYPHMTVAQNMSFALRLARVDRTEIATRVARAAQILGLEQLLDRYPRQLSGGQRQRVAMGRALVRDPQVFLFDEPLSNLDAKLRMQMRAEIKELQQRLKTTTVYVTHDQIEAMTMADKIVIMRSGHIEQIGAPLDLYDRPDNLFVAGFLGSPAMNFVSCTIADGAAVSASGARWPLSSTIVQAGGMAAGRRIVYGVRPEHFRLSEDGMAARVMVVEPTGSETQVLLEVGGEKLTAAFRERIALGVGETLRVAIDPEAIHIFDVESGKRVAAPR